MSTSSASRSGFEFKAAFELAGARGVRAYEYSKPQARAPALGRRFDVRRKSRLLAEVAESTPAAAAGQLQAAANHAAKREGAARFISTA